MRGTASSRSTRDKLRAYPGNGRGDGFAVGLRRFWRTSDLVQARHLLAVPMVGRTVRGTSCSAPFLTLAGAEAKNSTNVLVAKADW